MWQLPYLQDVHTKSNNQINYLAGGISNIYPAQAIQDDECQDMYNLCLDRYPAIRTRIGRTMVKNPGLKGDTIKYFRSSWYTLSLLYTRNSIKRYGRYSNSKWNNWY